jgi:DNA modification methylase
MAIDVAKLEISSPKRDRHVREGWECYFPYYAGYPQAFADRLIKSANLDESAMILDPWNGSGTTTFSASRLGLASVGIDLNPVMSIVARKVAACQRGRLVGSACS